MILFAILGLLTLMYYWEKDDLAARIKKREKQLGKHIHEGGEHMQLSHGGIHKRID